MGRWDKKESKPEPSVSEVSEVKHEVKSEQPQLQKENLKTVVAQAESSSTPVYLGSEIDAYVHERVKGQPKTLEEIKVKDVEADRRPNILALPRELEKYGKEYSFRWINKKKRSIDNALDVIGWTLVTRNFFNDLPKHVWGPNGVIERGDAILAFMEQRRAERIRLRPAEVSRERVNNTPVQDLRKWKDRGDRYYKPDLGAAEDDNEPVRGHQVVLE